MARSGPRRQRKQKPKGRKLSVMVIHRIKDTMALSSSVEAHKARLAAAIRERYSPRLRPEEELPDYVLALELTVRDVQAALQELIRVDDAVDFASAKYGNLRREQDLLVRDELYPRTVSVRAPAPEEAAPPVKETVRVSVPGPIAAWLEKNRIFGT